MTDERRPEAAQKECVCDPITVRVLTFFSNLTEKDDVEKRM